jgi:hypothetical protein
MGVGIWEMGRMAELEEGEGQRAGLLWGLARKGGGRRRRFLLVLIFLSLGFSVFFRGLRRGSGFCLRVVYLKEDKINVIAFRLPCFSLLKEFLTPIVVYRLGNFLPFHYPASSHSFYPPSS